jgi:hypothetical protein
MPRYKVRRVRSVAREHDDLAVRRVLERLERDTRLREERHRELRAGRRRDDRALLKWVRRREHETFTDPYLQLRADRLSKDELTQLWRLTDNGDPHSLSKRDRARYEQLVEKAADQPGLFQRRRDEIAAEKHKAQAGRLHREMLARRPQPEPGSVALPSYLTDWLLDNSDGGFTAQHLGVLTTLMFVFAAREPRLIAKAPLEDADGVPMVVVEEAAARGVWLAAAAGGDDIRGALGWLRLNDWLVTENNRGVCRIQPGSNMREALGEEICGQAAAR